MIGVIPSRFIIFILINIFTVFCLKKTCQIRNEGDRDYALILELTLLVFLVFMAVMLSLLSI